MRNTLRRDQADNGVRANGNTNTTTHDHGEDVSDRRLKQAVTELEDDYSRGEYSGGGYRYIEADPASLRLVLDHLKDEA